MNRNNETKSDETKPATAIMFLKLAMSGLVMLAFVLLNAASDAESHPMKFHKMRKLGVGYLNMKLEAKEADTSFIATSLDIFGFEDDPYGKDSKQQAIVDKIRKHIKKNRDQMLLFDPELGCTSKVYVLGTFVGEHEPEKGDETAAASKPTESSESSEPSKNTDKKTNEPEVVEEVIPGPKADIHLRFQTVCKKPFKGKVINFGLTTVFPKVKKIKLHLINGTTIKARYIKNNRGKVTP